MRNVMVGSLMIFLLLAFSCAGREYKGSGEEESTIGKASQKGVIARIDGKEIHLSDLDYDIQKGYDLELHKLKEKLYREQRSKLNEMIDKMLLEKEAERRETTPEKLIAMINSKAEADTKDLKVDKEKLYQEFLDNLKKSYPGFSEMSEDKKIKTIKRILRIKSDFKGSLTDEIKNKIVEMKKRTKLHNEEHEFLEELRAKADIEILLKRPGLIHLDVTPDDDPYLGGKDAKITLIEFADYQCPFCSKIRPILKDLLDKEGDKIKIVFRDLPLSSHKNAKVAAEAAECADEQGKFWEYHDLLFDNQKSLDVENLKKYAESIGLDVRKFNQCLESGNQSPEVEKDAADAKMAGIRSTPSILVNGYYISGTPSAAYLEEVIADIERGRVPRIREDISKGKG